MGICLEEGLNWWLLTWGLFVVFWRYLAFHALSAGGNVLLGDCAYHTWITKVDGMNNPPRHGSGISVNTGISCSSVQSEFQWHSLLSKVNLLYRVQGKKVNPHLYLTWGITQHEIISLRGEKSLFDFLFWATVLTKKMAETKFLNFRFVIFWCLVSSLVTKGWNLL